MNHRLDSSNSGIQLLADARRLLYYHLWPGWFASKGCIRPLGFVIVSPSVERHPSMDRVSLGQKCGPRAVVTPLFASAWSRCCRRFCIFAIAEPCYQFGLFGVSYRLAVPSAGGSASLRCSLRISRLYHGFGHGWIWSCFTRRVAKASTSSVVSPWNFSSCANRVASAPSLLPWWCKARGFGPFAGSRLLGRASRGACFDMGATVVHTFALLRPRPDALQGAPWLHLP